MAGHFRPVTGSHDPPSPLAARPVAVKYPRYAESGNSARTDLCGGPAIGIPSAILCPMTR